MKLLIISPSLPFPLNSGGNVAQFHIIEKLREKVDVSFLFPLKSSNKQAFEELRKRWSNVSFYPFIQNQNFYYYFNRISLILHQMSLWGKEKELSTLSADAFYTKQFLEYIEDVFSKDSFDIVQTEFYNYLNLIHLIPNSIKTVFIQHEIRFVMNEIRESQTKAKNTHKRFCWRKLKAEEIATMNKYDAVITLTEVDKKKIVCEGVNTRVYTSAAGIEMTVDRNECKFLNKLIFVGGSAHSPNVASLKWFLENVWDSIVLKYPCIVLNIIGNWSKAEQKKITKKYKNIVFKGFVKDLKAEFDGAISIVPIIIGSGMRMKIIDSVNYGSPFITTSIGVEGLEFRDGEECFIADESTDFTEKLIKLIDRDTIREKFYKQSMDVLLEKYSIQNLALLRKSIYENIVEI